jgi:Holliday junction resolvase RusA-like endonuclease
MRKLVMFEALGLDAVPWSVPDIGITTTRTGKRVRFARRRKKSALALGKASLDDWQRFVAESAREAMAAIPIATGPIRVHMEFLTQTPPGHKHGELWSVPVRFNEEAGEWVKTQPRGKPEPDLVNLFKGTEDAIQSVVFANDVQTRVVSAVALYGPCAGVRVHVYEIEPGDFPGLGNPMS